MNKKEKYVAKPKKKVFIIIHFVILIITLYVYFFHFFCCCLLVYFFWSHEHSTHSFNRPLFQSHSMLPLFWFIYFMFFICWRKKSGESEQELNMKKWIPIVARWQRWWDHASESNSDSTNTVPNERKKEKQQNQWNRWGLKPNAYQNELLQICRENEFSSATRYTLELISAHRLFWCVWCVFVSKFWCCIFKMCRLRGNSNFLHIRTTPKRLYRLWIKVQAIKSFRFLLVFLPVVWKARAQSTMAEDLKE